MNEINRYMIAFPSVSKAGYAQEKLRSIGYSPTVGKSPAGLLQTCGYAVYLEVMDVNHLISFLDQTGIEYSGVFLARLGQYKKIR